MLNRLYAWYGKRVVLGVLLGVIILIGVGIFLGNKSTEAPALEVAKITKVQVASVGALKTGSGFSVVGQVSALSEAKLQTEAGGRVTRVNVAIGDLVAAGTILAALENSEEQASLLQAEGAYESALAGSRQSDVSLKQAEITVQNTYRETFATSENIVRNLLDEFFINPGTTVSGFRLSGTGKAEEFNTRRIALETLLQAWSTSLSAGSAAVDANKNLAYAESALASINQFTADIYTAVADTNQSDSKYTTEELTSYKNRLAAARSELAQAESSVLGAKQALEQATIAGSAGVSSQSSAAIKSALGNLRSAQARFEKTLVRTPISGVVNALYIKAGEYAAAGQPAALVANNGALEISTSLGESDLVALSVGDTVRINNTADGKITKIAPAIDPLTQKAEVKISVDDALLLTNGTTATVAFVRNLDQVKDSKIISLPLAAVKLLPSGSIVFGVSDESKLVAYPVELGAILGEAVEIVSGLDVSQEIVIDARGLKEGEVVAVTK